MTRIAVLDDYQAIASSMADWSSLPGDASVTFFNDHVKDPGKLGERLAGYEIVCIMRERTPFTREVFEALPDLKLLVTSGRRNASVDLDAASAHGVTVCGTAGLSQPTPELAWGLILSLARHIPFEAAGMRGGQWQTSVGTGLHGKTLGILGLGRLGRQVAKYARAFEMDVVAWSRSLTDETAKEHGARRVEKDELLRISDFVSIHIVLSDASRGLVGKRELELMKPTAYIVNTSRGPIIDEEALVEALNARTIAGAGIDVYGDEPLPAAAPIREAANAVLTPHLGYVTKETYEVFYGETLENILAWLKGDAVRVLNP